MKNVCRKDFVPLAIDFKQGLRRGKNDVPICIGDQVGSSGFGLIINPLIHGFTYHIISVLFVFISYI